MWQPNQFKEYIPRQTTRAETLFYYGIFAILLAFTMPWLKESFAPTGDTLDVSWAWMLGYGLQHHLQWGKSILFTYGPLGFLASPYFYSDHILWAMAALVRLTSWITFGLGFAMILNRLRPAIRIFPRFALPVVIAWLIGASLVDLATQAAFIGILLLVLALGDKSKKLATISLLVAGIILAFGSLVKSTSLIIAFFILCVYPLLWWYAQPQKQKLVLSLLPLLSFVISFCALWAFAGQDIVHLPAYIQGTLTIASGYTPAMSIHGKGLQTAAALIILFLFIIATFMLLFKKERTRLAQSIILGVMVFWAWKEGFTRHDPGFGGHAMAFFGTALLVAAVGLVLFSEESQRSIVINVAGIYLLALTFALLPGASAFSANEIDNYSNFASLVSSKAHREAQQHEETSAIASQFHLKPALLSAVKNHSVNIIPWNLMMAQGYHMDLVASPVFQAYSVYTPYLDHLNAQQIYEEKSADKAIYTFASIDGRYPIFDEPATFRALLTCYKTQYAGNPYTVLTRSQCVKPKLTPVDGKLNSHFNQWMSVPEHSSYVNIGVQTTVTGHIINMLYKPNQIHILFRLSDGAIKGPYRFIYPLGDDGLFVKYFINGQHDANRLFAKNATGLQRISAFKLTTANSSLDYSKAFYIRFFTTNPPYRWKVAQLPLPSRLVAQIENNMEYTKAWDELSGIYFARPDLQKAFPLNSSASYKELLQWAGVTVPAADPAAVRLRPFQAAYKSMLGRLK
ncbi:hypothetical protein Acife_3017 [Acidithiobacillus ferrivorans SS3]|uniref:Transmembrane protein n=1 Tax=Acidithiobacillus ferrivorans SS3 TaxID=743299 RepID=G0JUC1_9PROT|nr:hypothetical protein [Acidithiobacillus ferrivorans]AEM49090.1 hypothetical protein Acife_3017 [Acidithiobacillus ferrivorans SS3]